MLKKRGNDSEPKMLKVAESKSPAFDELDLIVNPLDHPTGRAAMKVIGDTVALVR